MTDETTSGGQPRPKKNQQAAWVKQDLDELWGLDRRVSEITWENLEELRRCFQTKYPANRRKLKKYKDMSLRQLADGPDIPPEERIKGSTKESASAYRETFSPFSGPTRPPEIISPTMPTRSWRSRATRSGPTGTGRATK